MSDFTIEGETVTFWLKVKPRASRERLRMRSSGELKLEVHAPPADGQANEEVARFLAKLLALPRNSIEIVTGRKSRRKLVRIRGISAEETMRRLKQAGIRQPIDR